MLEVLVVALLTNRKEERNIEAAIRSIVPLTRSILIIDSYSTDRTTEIVQSLAQTLKLDLDLVSREYKSPSDQKNWGIRRIIAKYKTEKESLYILILDADESLTTDLIAEIRSEINLNSADCYYLPRANHFMGRFIKHSSWYPDYNLRFFKAETAYYEDVKVHEHMIPNGRVKYLKSPMIHNAYTSISQYIDRMNRYTDWEVDNLQLKRNKLSQMGRMRKIFYSLPGRPLLRALYMYFFRLGFLDGKQGFHLAILSGLYEYLVNLKIFYRTETDRLNVKVHK